MPSKMKLYSVDYYGSTLMDRRFSKQMLPWIIAEIKRRKSADKMCLGVQDGYVQAFNLEVNAGQDAVFQHPLGSIARISQSYDNHCTFMYLLRDQTESLLSCHLYQAQQACDVVELLTSMKDQSKENAMAGPLNPRTQSNAAQLTSLCADISPSSSHFFEVLYIGKIKVSHRKVPDSFIDDALEKFKAHELEKEKLRHLKTNGSSNNLASLASNDSTNNLASLASNDSTNNLASLASNDSTNNLTVLSDSSNNNGTTRPTTNNVIITICKDEDGHRRGSEDSGATIPLQSPTVLSPGMDPHKMGGSVETLPTLPISPSGPGGFADRAGIHPVQNNKDINSSPMRNRAASTGSVRDLKKTEPASAADHNRTMLFLVGRTDLRLISPDRKQILLHKNLRDVARCIQGVQHAEHFGFICREPDCYMGFVFRCQSPSFADDVVSAITQAFLSTSDALRREKPPVFSCEHCPMVWYHRLCAEAEGLSDKRTQATIFRRLELLPEEETSVILTKFHGAELATLREQNEFLMMLLRAHCEAKQARHAHDTAENRSEFLNQYLGGSTIFMKAKRSLTSSFDHLLKRKGSKDDFGPIIKELSLPQGSMLTKDGSHHLSSTTSLGDGSGGSGNESQSESSTPRQRTRKRSSTLGSTDGEAMKRELALNKQYANHPANRSGSSSKNGSNNSLNSQLSVITKELKSTPMMNIFLKVGNQPKTSPPLEMNQDTSRQSGSWRQAIYNRVVTPNKNMTDGGSGAAARQPAVKRGPDELRALWKKAINQQLILIRMEKENARLTARQEEATVKRIKLEYDEISHCVREVSEVWDLLVSRESRVSTKCDTQMLLQAMKQGVPRSKRGDVWLFLAEQFCLKQPPLDTARFPNYNAPYETLLKQLTSHQHGILIDLGRTFPSHPYFSSPLGPGQLALFNLLKAYSLLDSEVGYCQGLSFVAGILLLHMSESQAFFLLRHLMFRRCLRYQYLPDMAALQVQLYQLSRLLHDQLPEIDAHFDAHEIAPTLYAAPWLLTLFASQFPLGFVTRVFDLLFLEGQEVLFRFAVALLSEHKDGLLACNSFEEIMEYLKVTLPAVDKPLMDRVMKQVFSMDVARQLREYEVEYLVLQEEMSAPRPDPEEMERLERENRALVQQLQISTSNIQRLETTRSMQQTSINRLESQVRSLEVSIAAMGNFLSNLVDTNNDIELPGEVRRIVSQLEVANQRRLNQGQALLLRGLKEQKGVPLRVINSEENYYVPQKTQSNVEATTKLLNPTVDKTKLLKTTSSSPNLSLKLAGMTQFFQNHAGQKGQKQMSGIAFLSPNEPFTEPKGNAAARTEAKPTLFPGVKSASDGNKVVLTPDSRAGSETRDLGFAEPKHKLRTSHSSFELGLGKVNNDSGDSGNVTPTSPSIPSIHPLDTCSGVSFNYSGTTKLKTIRPLRANLTRNPSTESISSVKRGGSDADVLNIGETGDNLTSVTNSESVTAR